MVKVLHDAWQYRKLTSRQQQAQRHAAAQGAQPAARVGTSASPPAGLGDSLSVDEWARRRNEQGRKRRREGGLSLSILPVAEGDGEGDRGKRGGGACRRAQPLHHASHGPPPHGFAAGRTRQAEPRSTFYPNPTPAP